MAQTAAQRAAYMREWRRKNPEANRTYLRNWHKKNKQKYLTDCRRRKGFPEPTRPCPAVCECCGEAPGKKSLALDHDHETGAFRGWLCVRCNAGIGLLGDNTAGLAAAINYLSRAHA